MNKSSFTAADLLEPKRIGETKIIKYEFMDVKIEGGLKARKTEAFDRCKQIIMDKSKEGWELIQILPVVNEKSGVGGLLQYTGIFRVGTNKNYES